VWRFRDCKFVAFGFQMFDESDDGCGGRMMKHIGAATSRASATPSRFLSAPFDSGLDRPLMQCAAGVSFNSRGVPGQSLCHGPSMATRSQRRSAPSM